MLAFAEFSACDEFSIARLSGASCSGASHSGRDELRSVEIIDEHDVGIVFVELGVENVAAIVRNRDALVDVAICFKNFASFVCGEIVKADGVGSGLGNEVDSV